MLEKGQNESPGQSNTWAQRTDHHLPSAERAETQLTKHRQVRILLDWLGFSLDTEFWSAELVKKFFEFHAGISLYSWQEGRKNYEGYADSFVFENINIYYNGAENQGIHVDITGQGCRYIETQFQKLGVHEYNWFKFITDLQAADAGFTRVDIACDDFHGFFNVPQLLQKCLAGEVTSKFKSWRPDGNWSMDGKPNGITLYFGSAVSRINVVFYEKHKQLGISQEWTRTEIRFKKDRAEEFIKLFTFQNHEEGQAYDIGVIFASILKDYITFRERSETDSNKRRWVVSPFWDEFLEGIEKLRLASALPDRSIQKTRFWIDKQVSKSFAKMFFAYQDIPQFENWLREILEDGLTKLTDQDLAIINEFRRLYKKENAADLRAINDTSGKNL